METLTLILTMYGAVGFLVFLILGFMLAGIDENPVIAFVIGLLWPLALALWILIHVGDEE